jgi:hypothetical protein
MLKLDIKQSDIKKTESSIEAIINKRMLEVEKASIESLKTMEAEAVASAPSGRTGRLKSSIKWEQVGKLNYQLRADAPYAAYVEFGTGPYFKNYPGKESFWQKKAKEYFKTGKGTTYPRPYFYPTVTKNIIKLRERIKNILGKNA